MLSASILAILAESPEGVSVDHLATRALCSPSRLEAELMRLRQEGLQIVEIAERLHLRQSVGWGPATLRWRIGRPVAYLPTCSSTNRIARDLAQALGPGDPLPIVVADHQTEGRGRRGRSWAAEAGQNLLFTMVLRPELPPARVPRAVLAWAAAMAEALDVSLKWPNDLVVLRDGQIRKLGGILAELETRPSGGRAPVHPLVVLGVGLNVGQTAFPGLPQATSLAAEGRPCADRAALLGRLVAAVDRVDVHASDLLGLWRARACMLGRRVKVGDREGMANGIREDGALLVGGTPVLTGDVELVAGMSAHSGPPAPDAAG